MSKTDGGNVIVKAIKWWKMHRPCGWTQAQHLANPTVNTCTDSEKALALSIAEYIKLAGPRRKTA